MEKCDCIVCTTRREIIEEVIEEGLKTGKLREGNVELFRAVMEQSNVFEFLTGLAMIGFEDKAQRLVDIAVERQNELGSDSMYAESYPSNVIDIKKVVQ